MRVDPDILSAFQIVFLDCRTWSPTHVSWWLWSWWL